MTKTEMTKTQMTVTQMTMASVHQHVGKEIAISDWLPITQQDVDAFADCTRDHNVLHVDPVAARDLSPTGGTIAHGFYVLSLLSHFAETCALWPTDCAYGLNYGVNKVRWISPTPVGADIRARFSLLSYAPHKSGGMLMTTAVQVDIQGQERPAMAAEWLSAYFAEKPHK